IDIKVPPWWRPQDEVLLSVTASDTHEFVYRVAGAEKNAAISMREDANCLRNEESRRIRLAAYARPANVETRTRNAQIGMKLELNRLFLEGGRRREIPPKGDRERA